MSAESTAAVVGARLATPGRRTIGQLVAISIFWFALNFHWAAVGVLLVPSQIIALLLHEAPGATLAARATWANDHAGLAQALVVAPGLIVALITNPYFGLLSDRTPGRFGRRRPYILGGTLVNVIGLGVMALLPSLLVREGGGNPLAPSLFVLIGGLMLVQFGSNAAAAPFHALLPDMVPQQQRGTASGVMGLAYWLGTIGGSLAPTLCGFNSADLLKGVQSFAAYQQGILLGYGITAGVILLMALLTFALVREIPWHVSDSTAAERAEQVRMSRTLALTIGIVLLLAGGAYALIRAQLGFTLDTNSLGIVQLVGVLIASVGAARAFNFSPRRNPDFTWVVVTRMLVMLGVYIVQNFLLLYMLNVAHAPNPQSATTQFLIYLTLAATLSTALAGWASDRVGRKRIVYLSGSLMALVGVALVISPYLLPGNVLVVALASAFAFGLGFGAYVSVDWALVADVLPSEATYARDMGVWNIGLTMPQVVAVVFGGYLIALGIQLGNPTLGYTLLFIWFIVFCVLGTVTVRFIRGVTR